MRTKRRQAKAKTAMNAPIMIPALEPGDMTWEEGGLEIEVSSGWVVLVVVKKAVVVELLRGVVEVSFVGLLVDEAGKVEGVAATVAAARASVKTTG